MPEEKFESPIDALKGKVTDLTNEGRWSIACYIPVFNIVAVLVASVKMVNSQFVLFHARQGLVLFVFWLLTGLVSFFAGLVSAVLFAILLLLHLLGALFAFNKKTSALPIIGQFAAMIPETYLFELLTGQKPQSGDEKVMHQDPNNIK